MEFVKKYQNQVTALLQLLICAFAVVLAVRGSQNGKKRKRAKG